MRKKDIPRRIKKKKKIPNKQKEKKKKNMFSVSLFFVQSYRADYKKINIKTVNTGNFKSVVDLKVL